MGNTNYHGLELTWKRTTGPLTLLASYTYSKSLGQHLPRQLDLFIGNNSFAFQQRPMTSQISAPGQGQHTLTNA